MEQDSQMSQSLISEGEEGEGEKEADLSLDPLKLKLLHFQTIETSHGASKTLDFES